MRRFAVRFLLVAFVLYLALVATLFVAMSQPPDVFGPFMARAFRVAGPAFLVLPFETLWNVARAGDLTLGDAAPDFCLEPASGPDVAQPCVRLSSFRARRPVVLIFGSYT